MKVLTWLYSSPPHLVKAGDNSWLAKKYGKLSSAWPQDIKQGFDECMRVLKPNGTLIFKWNEEQIKLKEILNCINYKPHFWEQTLKNTLASVYEVKK